MTEQSEPNAPTELGSKPLLAEALEAIEYAEAIMSEDVLNAVTGDYAADHCIYDAINLLKAVMEKANAGIERPMKPQEGGMT